MSDERIVEALAQSHRMGALSTGKTRLDEIARAALAALRDAGFEVYRPDECIEARLTSLSLNRNQPQRVGFEVVSVHQVPTPPTLSPDGDAPTYRLVPVESPKENE